MLKKKFTMQAIENKSEPPDLKTCVSTQEGKQSSADLSVESTQNPPETLPNDPAAGLEGPNLAPIGAREETASANPSGEQESKRMGPPLGSANHKTHGDYQRQRQIRERRRKAINGTTRNGKAAQKWRRWALDKKGGKSCSPDIKQKIESGTFYLWRALELRDYIIADYRERETLLNKRTRTLPKVHDQYDATMGEFLKINNQLSLPDYDVDDLFDGLGRNGSAL